jgi:hypothetical protein
MLSTYSRETLKNDMEAYFSEFELSMSDIFSDTRSPLDIDEESNRLFIYGFFLQFLKDANIEPSNLPEIISTIKYFYISVNDIDDMPVIYKQIEPKHFEDMDWYLHYSFELDLDYLNVLLKDKVKKLISAEYKTIINIDTDRYTAAFNYRESENTHPEQVRNLIITSWDVLALINKQIPAYEISICESPNPENSSKNFNKASEWGVQLTITNTDTLFKLNYFIGTYERIVLLGGDDLENNDGVINFSVEEDAQLDLLDKKYQTQLTYFNIKLPYEDVYWDDYGNEYFLLDSQHQTLDTIDCETMLINLAFKAHHDIRYLEFKNAYLNQPEEVPF